jgi:hypothetical protein
VRLATVRTATGTTAVRVDGDDHLDRAVVGRLQNTGRRR